MLKLKNVSKFYYSKGVIASGFTKVSVSFDIGEFVVITGESGSGKSTLLNVISGLDSYEEGEMYINGLETSHYGEADFEEYRKKYVSNIFQHFNLVNSYTVYQNVELVLLMNGYKKKEIRSKVLDLIERVGLTKFKNTKVSKLSGGQKQRVAIARALAKETPIIVCDEPTANLDSKSSREIIKILKEISRDKLLVMVTHDFASVSEVATRVIKMHDGRIMSDKEIEDVKVGNKIEIDNKNKKIGLFNIIRLGIRNTFNILPKFVLMFIVNLFVVASIITEYGSLRKSEYESSKLGYNYYFNDTTDTRIIIKKNDGSSITREDFNKLENLSNVSSIVENDIILDEYVWLESVDDNSFYVDGLFRDIDSFDGELDYGRMPETDNEIVVMVQAYDYNFKERLEEAVKTKYYLNSVNDNIILSVVGVKYIEENIFNYVENKIYVNSNLLDEYMKSINRNYSTLIINSNGENYEGYNYLGNEFNVLVSDKVSKGNAIVCENINYICKDYDCKNKNITVSVDNLHYEDSISLKVVNTYNEWNSKGLLGIDVNDYKYGSIFINTEDYDYLFHKDSYQVSVFANKVDNVDKLENTLEEMGYYTMAMKNSLNNDGMDTVKVIKIAKLVVTVVLVVTLFFISYFVIKLILKSRNVYFSTLRILGANARQTKKILDVELFINSSLAYVFYIGFVLLIKNGIININFIKSSLEYVSMMDYVLVYLILVVMSYLISSRFASKMFKKSALKSYREEV